MMKAKYLILHCSATPEGRYFDKIDIIKWHTAPKPVGNGWSKPGYRDIFLIDGTIQNLIPYDTDETTIDSWEISNGVAGYNAVSAHICHIGGQDKTGKKAKDTRTARQKEELECYVLNYISNNPDVQVGGHCQFDTKKPNCPGYDVPAWLRSIGVAEKNIYKG